MSRYFIAFTDEEKERANHTNLIQYLQSQGATLQNAGKEYFLKYSDASGTHDSISISRDGLQWFDHKNQVGGGPIKFLMHRYDLNYKEAMQELLGYTPSQQRTDFRYIPPAVEEEKKEFSVPVPNADNRRLYGYLMKSRHLSAEVINHFVQKGDLYEENLYHNAVFIGRNKDGIAKQASVRTTSTQGNHFRLTVSGSDTTCAFAHIGQSDALLVFEAPIDMMSFISLHGGNGWQQNSYLAMDGVAIKALLKTLEDYPHIQQINICTDNDAGGYEAYERITDTLRDMGYKKLQRYVSQYKDWNEDLKSLNGDAPIPAAIHKHKALFLQESADLCYYPLDEKKMLSDIDTAFANQQWQRVAETALAESALLAVKAKGNVTEEAQTEMFMRLKSLMQNEYRAYKDKKKLVGKLDELGRMTKTVRQESAKYLKHGEAAPEKLKELGRRYFDLAASAIKLSVEQQTLTPSEVQDVVQSEEAELSSDQSPLEMAVT